MIQVATWPEEYGIDGIDLDLEEGAGSKYVLGPIIANVSKFPGGFLGSIGILSIHYITLHYTHTFSCKIKLYNYVHMYMYWLSYPIF